MLEKRIYGLLYCRNHYNVIQAGPGVEILGTVVAPAHISVTKEIKNILDGEIAAAVSNTNANSFIAEVRFST